MSKFKDLIKVVPGDEELEIWCVYKCAEGEHTRAFRGSRNELRNEFVKLHKGFKVVHIATKPSLECAVLCIAIEE